MIDGLEDTISRISSTKATGGDDGAHDETDKLLNIDFAEELNFRFFSLLFLLLGQVSAYLTENIYF